MPELILFVAHDQNRAIGINKGMPWHVSTELKLFRSATLGLPVIMGRTTHESIGLALPGRTNIIVSTTMQQATMDCILARNLEDAYALAGEYSDTAAVIGGAAIYRQALPYASRIQRTVIDIEVEGDRFFPELIASQ